MQKRKKPLITISPSTNPLLNQLVDRINSDIEIKTLWEVVNVNAVQRLGMTDHGPQHFQIVLSNALSIQHLLASARVNMSIATDFQLSYAHAEVVVALASLLHDIGMSINRVGHEEFSLFLTNQLLKNLLDFLPEKERIIVSSETLHAIISHRSNGTPLTIEAGIVRVADALDMTKGRSRLPYDDSTINIHSVSAMAIDAILIKKGEHTPVQIEVTMNHTAGIFQVDELLKKKVFGSGIEKYLEIKIYILRDGKKKLFKDFYLKQ